jgi:hypothetical protein
MNTTFSNESNLFIEIKNNFLIYIFSTLIIIVTQFITYHYIIDLTFIMSSFYETSYITIYNLDIGYILMLVTFVFISKYNGISTQSLKYFTVFCLGISISSIYKLYSYESFAPTINFYGLLFFIFIISAYSSYNKLSSKLKHKIHIFIVILILSIPVLSYFILSFSIKQAFVYFIKSMILYLIGIAINKYFQNRRNPFQLAMIYFALVFS